MRKTLLAAAVTSLLFAACETTTPYQPADKWQHGYADQQIERNRWAVKFTGNSLTDRQTVETFLLYRSAELTVQSGYDYFEIVARQTDSETTYLSNAFATPFYYNFYGVGPHPGFYAGPVGFGPGRLYGGRRGRRFARGGFGFNSFGYYDPFFGGPTQFQEQVSYEASAEILMRKGAKPDEAAYFDAADVVRTLGPTITRPETNG